MNHSLVVADRGTHLKIVAVALAAATIVVAIGVNARIADTSTVASRVYGPVFTAGKPSIYTSTEASAIR
jgi:hypothetical protein